MSQVDAQKLQQMVEALTKRVGVLDQQYVPNVEKRVARLEDYVGTLQKTLADQSLPRNRGIS